MYRINVEMLGPDATSDDVERAAEWLNAHGYECEATSDSGNIGSEDETTPSEALWEQMLSELFWNN